MALEFAGPATRLGPSDVADEAALMLCAAPALHAVFSVECAGSGFLPDGRPSILYEAEVFWQKTDGQFGTSNVSSPRWDRSLYGPGGAHQYDRLAQAIALDREAALMATSWGLPQILGENYAAAGFDDVEAFVAAMCQSEKSQLAAFGHFVSANPRMLAALRATPPQFSAFAAAYNGPGYAVNGYDVKMAAAWRAARTAAPAPPPPNSAPRTNPTAWASTLQLNSAGQAVVALQRKLNAVASAGLDEDGDFGPETLAAVVTFQRGRGLLPDGIVGPRTAAALWAGTAS